MSRTLRSWNRLEVPEIVGYTTRDGITSYAIREPGCVLWLGFAADGERSVYSPSIHTDPADAIREARHILTGR